MEKEYEIEIQETLQKVIKVNANSLDEALDIAKQQYENEEITLDYNDLKDTNFKEYTDEIDKTLRVVYKKVGEKPVVIEIEDTLEKEQELVGGLIEVVPYNELLIIANEEGKLMNLTPNVAFDYDYIAGDFFVVGDDYENAGFKSLTDEEIKNTIEDLEKKTISLEEKTQEKAKKNKHYER